MSPAFVHRRRSSHLCMLNIKPGPDSKLFHKSPSYGRLPQSDFQRAETLSAANVKTAFERQTLHMHHSAEWELEHSTVGTRRKTHL